MTVAERNRRLFDAARQIEAAVPGLYGSVRFDVQDGRVRTFEVRDSVKVAGGRPMRAYTTPFGAPPEDEG